MIPIALTPKTIGIAFVVLAVAGLGTYVTILKGQRDGLRERVAGLEHQLELERSEYEHSKAEWGATLQKVEDAIASADSRRVSAEEKMSGLASRLALRERELNKTNRELAEARADAVTSSDCTEAVGQFLETLGWAEGDIDETD